MLCGGGLTAERAMSDLFSDLPETALLNDRAAAAPGLGRRLLSLLGFRAAPAEAAPGLPRLDAPSGVLGPEILGEDALTPALEDLAERRPETVDHAVRILVAHAASPILLRLLPAACALAGRGVRVALALHRAPVDPETLEALGPLRRALGGPPLDRFLRVVDFPGAGDFTEQAMIGDRLHWAGAPLRAEPMAVEYGLVTDLHEVVDGPAAARLGFAAAWRLGAPPSVRLIKAVRAVSE